MAIIINNKNLYRRVISWQDVQKVVLNWKEIRPTWWNIDYHVVSNRGTGGWGWWWTWVPWGWSVSWSTSIDEDYVSNEDLWIPAKLSYNWMPSLLNAFKVEIIYHLYRTQESTEKPFSTNLTLWTGNSYLSEITQSSWRERSFLAWNDSDNDELTWATAWEYTITTVLDLENSEATQTIEWPNSFEQELELTLDDTDIYNIRHSDAFWIELNNGMRLYRVDFFVYNNPQNPQVLPWIYHNATLWLISYSLDWENWITIADKDLWASEVYGQGLLYQRGNNHWFPAEIPSKTSTTTIDVGWYWPWNYYEADTFIIGDAWYNNWYNSTGNYRNLRWGVTNTELSKRWPCPEGYHIPTWTEFDTLTNIITTLVGSDEAEDCHQYFLINSFETLDYDGDVHASSDWYSRRCWLSSYDTQRWNPEYAHVYTTPSWVGSYGACYWLPIRPFKNTYAVPDNTRTVLFQPE